MPIVLKNLEIKKIETVNADNETIRIRIFFNNFIAKTKNNRTYVFMNDTDSYKNNGSNELDITFDLDIISGRIYPRYVSGGERRGKVLNIVKDMDKNYVAGTTSDFNYTIMFDNINNFEKIIAFTIKNFLEKNEKTKEKGYVDIVDIKYTEELLNSEFNYVSNKVIMKLDRKKIENTRLKNTKLMKSIDAVLLNILVDKALDDGDEELFKAASKELSKIKGI